MRMSLSKGRIHLFEAAARQIDHSGRLPFGHVGLANEAIERARARPFIVPRSFAQMRQNTLSMS